MKISLITTVLDLLGVFANGILGGAIARSEDMDLIGFISIGLVSGLGGGILRDVLLERGTPVALVNSAYIPTALAGALIAFLIHVQHKAWDRIYMILDAAALTVWAIAGAQKAIAAGLGWMPAVLLGAVTAVGGGVARDMMLQRRPAVFGRSPLYATVALLVAAIQVLSTEAFGARLAAGTIAAMVGGFLLRIVAAWRGWALPSGLNWKPAETVSKLTQRVQKKSSDA